MWSKSPLLLLRVRAAKEGKGIRLALVLAGYVLTGFLLCWEPLLSLLPGEWAEKPRAAVDAALVLLWGIGDSEPQEYLHVETGEKKRKVLVELRTLGIGKGKER